jgi:predicted alpha/beta hydrolase family esterase
MGERVILAGHSIGASVLIKMLTVSGAKPATAGVFLVAPPFWHDDDFWHWDEAALSEDAAAQFPSDVPLFLYRGDDDTTIPARHVDLYAKALPQAVIRRVSGRDHQFNNDLSEVARDIASVA